MPAKPIPTNPIRDVILERLVNRSNVRPHPSQRKANGTKYISAFTLGGVVFAVDKMCAGKQPIWVLDRADIRTYLDTENLSYDVYTPDERRNSNLHKLPNFEKGQLLRIYPDTVDQGMAVIAKLERKSETNSRNHE
ncbi:hypothetical protein LJR010_006041 [Ensifer adhaerens]|uniref:hypothetical protein n=1 Tax=Ensifer adhaerens TaxID=106592 RepID=UPI00399B376B